MTTLAHAAPASNKALWVGRIFCGLTVLFLTFDGAIKLAKIQPVIDAFRHLGWPVEGAVGIGVLQLACTALYAMPRTALLGAVMLTGFLGGAVATHVRIGDPFWFPIALGALMWLGLHLRDERVRTLLP
jgi:hypothetical protein